METKTNSGDPAAAEKIAVLGATQSRYGIDAIEIDRITVPAPGPNEVRVQVEAASINPADWYGATGSPKVFRVAFGLRKPKNPVVGADGAGVIEAVGADVEGYAVGDRVFGKFRGSFAESALASVDRIVRTPDSIDSMAAAGLPIAGVTAWQALDVAVDAGLVAGRTVVVNGASGGVGHYAIQIARALGAAEVVGVCSAANADLVAELGAHRVVDYNAEDFTENPADVIIDNVGNRSLGDIKRGLRPGGLWIGIGVSMEEGLFGPLKGLIGATIGAKLQRIPHRRMMADETVERLGALAELAGQGALRTHIGASYELAQIGEAFRHLETRRAVGKLIVCPRRSGQARPD